MTVKISLKLLSIPGFLVYVPMYVCMYLHDIFSPSHLLDHPGRPGRPGRPCRPDRLDLFEKKKRYQKCLSWGISNCNWVGMKC